MNGWNNVIKSPFITFIVIIIALLNLLHGVCYAQKFNFDYNLKRDAISFEMVKNLIIIPMFINNKGPYNFILDTGVDPLIITDSSIVERADLVNLRRVKINGTGDGEEIAAYISNHIRARVGKASMENLPAVILRQDVFNFSSYLGIKIHGLIGYNFFNSFIVKINYDQTRISFKLPQTRKRIKWNKLDLEFLDNKPYLNVDLVVPNLGNIKAKLIIDCGASHALSLETDKGGVFPLPTPSFKANLGVGLGGKINGSIGRITSIQLGDYLIKNVLTSFPNFSDVAAKAGRKERTGNLGAEILKKFTIIFDYQDAAMYLKKNNFYRQAFEHDMSGLEIYVDNNNFNRVYISRVEPASPGERAGILADDEILSINFLKIEDYSIDSITDMLKSQNGRTILIEFVRKDKIFIKLLTLKRRL